MGPEELRECVAIVGGKVPTEASGGVTLETIGALGASGVTYVSVGRLTPSAPAADIGLVFLLAWQESRPRPYEARGRLRASAPPIVIEKPAWGERVGHYGEISV